MLALIGLQTTGLWVLQSSKEKLKTILMQNFLRTNKVHHGRCARGKLTIFESHILHDTLFAPQILTKL